MSKYRLAKSAVVAAESLGVLLAGLVQFAAAHLMPWWVFGAAVVINYHSVRAFRRHVSPAITARLASRRGGALASAAR
jgi:hypothetical protein